jgi:hypothetical protein
MLTVLCEKCYGNWRGCEECNRGYIEAPESQIVYVNVYSVTRHYGGPEEGGWYYNWMECIETYPVKNINSQLIKEELEDEHNRKKFGNIYSVLGGRDIEVYIEEAPKASETRERPYYS